MSDFLEWNKSHRVGNADTDAEHQKIIHLGNTFLNGLAQGKSEKILDKLLENLIEVTQKHFTAEEKFLKKKGLEHSLSIKHKDEHDNLLKEIKMLKHGYARAKLGIDDVLPFFKEWLFDHIDKMDKGSFKRIASLSQQK